jgi:4-amino-4-deoxy-L-arabinose transferase-like glycosyltransferase
MLPLKKEVLVFLTAFGVRLLAFLFLLWWFRISGHMQDPTAIFPYPVLGGDSTDYAVLTQNLWQHGTFSSSLSMPLIPESFRLPGYPFFLYLFQFLPFPFIVAIIVQIAMGAATATLVYLFGKKFLSEKAGLIGALLFAIEPTSVLFSITIMSDTIFVFTLLLGIYLLLHKTKTLWGAIAVGFFAGILFGYAVLVRVIAQYLAVFLIAAYLLINRKNLRPWRRTTAKLAVFVLAIILVMLPWALRNERVFNTYTLSSTPYINFTQYNLVYFYAYKNNVSKEVAQHVYADRIPYPLDSFWFRSLINEEIFKQEMKEGLHGNIVPYAMFHLVKTLPFFLNDGLRDINRMIGFFPPPVSVVNFTDLLLQRNVRGVIDYLKTPQPDLWMLLIGSTVWVLISILSIGYALYAVIARQKNVWFVLFALGVIFYFGVLSSPVIQPRYRMPAAPFMLLLSAEAGLMLYSLTKKRVGH